MQHAYLFDIDGTLIKIKNRANRIIIQQILQEIDMNGFDVSEHDFAGKTDRAIFSHLLSEPPEDVFDQVKQLYLEQLEQNLSADDIYLFEGVRLTLSYLNKRSAWKGLLTGNFMQAAHIKLSKIGIADQFSFGAFGDAHHNRNSLPPEAFRSLKDVAGDSFKPSSLIIIGDTPRDILCARSFGAVSVAVATGNFSRKELASHNPDVVLNSLEEFPQWDSQFVESV